MMSPKYMVEIIELQSHIILKQLQQDSNKM